MMWIYLARDKFCIDPWMEVYLVLEEDGTEVDDEEYFQVNFFWGGELSYQNLQPKGVQHQICKEKWEKLQTLEKNTMLMLLLKEDIWSPEGPPYMWATYMWAP